jgi:hypothetical protein
MENCRKRYIINEPNDSNLPPLSGQTKDYKTGICCFCAKHAALRRKSKDWLARNKDNVSEWGDMSMRGRICTRPTRIVGFL